MSSLIERLYAFPYEMLDRPRSKILGIRYDLGWTIQDWHLNML